MTKIYGNIVEIDGCSKGVLEWDGDKIKSLTRISEPPADAEVFGDDYVIYPGFIDIHVHCREDVSQKEVHKEAFDTVGLAALNGGVVCIADMPNNPESPTTAVKHMKKSLLLNKCMVDVLLYAGIGPDTEPFSNKVPYKAFMGPSIGDLYFENNQQLDQTLNRYKGCSVSFHCEDPELLQKYSSQSTHETRRPRECEIEAVKVALDLIQKHQLTGKICHVSTLEALDIIRKAKEDGVNVFAEVTPHHLFFNESMLNRENHKSLQMNPPIRTNKDCLELFKGIVDSTIDFLASDHAPHTKEEKREGISGVPNLDTYGSFVTWLSGLVPYERIFHLACKNPGEWIGHFTGKKIGRFAPGYESSITIIKKTEVAANGRCLYSKCGWSPFDLLSLPGVVEKVYLRGELVVDGLYIKNQARA